MWLNFDKLSKFISIHFVFVIDGGRMRLHKKENCLDMDFSSITLADVKTKSSQNAKKQENHKKNIKSNHLS
jgi:hypothetical protein